MPIDISVHMGYNQKVVLSQFDQKHWNDPSNLKNVPLEPFPRSCGALDVSHPLLHPQLVLLDRPSPTPSLCLQQLALGVVCPRTRAQGVASANVDDLELAVAEGGVLPGLQAGGREVACVALLQHRLSGTVVGHDIGVLDVLDDELVRCNVASIVSALNTHRANRGRQGCSWRSCSGRCLSGCRWSSRCWSGCR